MTRCMCPNQSGWSRETRAEYPSPVSNPDTLVDAPFTSALLVWATEKLFRRGPLADPRTLNLADVADRSPLIPPSNNEHAVRRGSKSLRPRRRGV